MDNKAENVPLGSGMVGQAADRLKYRRYVLETTVIGEAPKEYEDWAKERQPTMIAKNPKK